MRIVIAIDSFKGSLTSLEAGEAVKEGIKEFCDEVEVVAVADGGEGSVEAMMSATNATFHEIEVLDPLGRKITAKYAKSSEQAIMEMASSSGLTLLTSNERNPLKTSTFGLGMMIRDGLNLGIRDFVIGIGGSATNDAGSGMLEALGYRFYDEDGNLLKANGANLIKIARIDSQNRLKELDEAKFSVACDVDNPLFGLNGAAYIYAAQKGADDAMIEELDRGLRSFARASSKFSGSDNSLVAGSGAAGGLGFGFMSFLNANLESGFRIISRVIGLEKKLEGADLVITGEGRLDHQSIMGKTPSEVAKLAKKQGITVVALGGCVSEGAKSLNEYVDAYFCILQNPVSLEVAMSKEVAHTNLSATANQMMRALMVKISK